MSMARSKKSMLILGGVVLGIALVAGLFGFIKFTDGQNFDPPSDSFWDGKASSTPDSLSGFSVTGSVQYMVWSEDDANLPNVSIINADGEDIFKECGDNCNVNTGFRQLGYFGIPTNDTQTYTITVTGDGNVYVLTPLEGLGNSLLGMISIGVGTCFSLCGLVILIIGLGMKSEDAPATQMVQPGMVAPQTQVQPGMVAQQPIPQSAQQEIPESQQWTDENGNMWRRLGDGSTQWWNGTEWENR